MRFNKRLATLAITGMVMTTMVGCASKKDTANTEAKLNELVITHVTSPLNVPSILQKSMNIFTEEFKSNGQNIEVKYAEITSGAEQTQALASGDVDILYAVGGTSVILSAANGADIKVLNMYSRSPKAFCLYSTDDSILTAEDLRGKTIAGPTGTNLHQLLVAYLDQVGMTLEDVNYVNMSIPDAKAALDGGSIDAALVAGPTAYVAKQQGYHLVTNGEGLTDAIIAVAVREDFYNEHKDVIDMFMDAQETIINYMEENEEETMEIVAKELDLDIEAVQEMYQQYDFDTEITEKDREAFQNVADFMHEAGMIEEEFDTSALYVK